jgi:hypothetical protein
VVCEVGGTGTVAGMTAAPEIVDTSPWGVVPVPTGPHPPPVDVAGPGVGTANLAFFSVALGAAGALLGVTVIWFFAAIPVGIAAVVTGMLALGRRHLGGYRSRAVLGTVLGIVAIVLGSLSAVFLPIAARELDAAATRVRDDVTGQIDKVDRSIAGDVDRMNTTVSRELREFSRQNRRALRELEGTSNSQLRRLERRLAASEKNLPAQQRIDLDRVARDLRRELAAVDKVTRGADAATQATIAAIVTRVQALEAALGRTDSAAGVVDAPGVTPPVPSP